MHGGRERAEEQAEQAKDEAESRANGGGQPSSTSRGTTPGASSPQYR